MKRSTTPLVKNLQENILIPSLRYLEMTTLLLSCVAVCGCVYVWFGNEGKVVFSLRFGYLKPSL